MYGDVEFAHSENEKVEQQEKQEQQVGPILWYYSPNI